MISIITILFPTSGVEGLISLSSNPLRYTARKLDSDSGFYYYRTRYYSAEMGSLLEINPIG